jgi:hypothetical protein
MEYGRCDRAYGYGDQLNRLRAGTYKRTVLNMYNESLSYDKKGTSCPYCATEMVKVPLHK